MPVETRTHEIRGIPLWLLRDYLVDLGGVVQADGVVRSPGWQGILSPLDDFRLGSLRVAQVCMELSGTPEALDQLEGGLKFKLLRAGG
jgi:hypothetical protein